MRLYGVAHILCVGVATAVIGATGASATLKVSTKPTQHVKCFSGICAANSAKAVLNVQDLAQMLSAGDVTVVSGSVARDIEIDAALSWTSSNRLALEAYHAIAFNEPLSVTGAGALKITTNDGGKNGDFRFFGKGRVEFWNLSSNLIINGNQYNLVKTIKDIGNCIRRDVPFCALAKSLNLSKHTYPKSPLRGYGNVFEGLGNKVSNLTISDDNDLDNVGFFGGLGGNALIRDLGLVNVDIIGSGSDQRVGSIAGYSEDITTSIVNCYASGEVLVSDAESRVGGIEGANNGTIARSFSAVVVSAEANANSAGGIAGQNGGVIDQSYSSGAVSGGDNVMTGGLVGYNFAGRITNSYATGAVVGGDSSFVGGLTGSNLVNGTQKPLITASYSTGSVTGDSGALVGGLIGEDLAQTGTSNSYWDMDTSGISDPSRGAGNVQNDPGITGLTTAQFIAGLPAGFDSSIWNENAKIGGGFPYLIDSPPQ